MRVFHSLMCQASREMLKIKGKVFQYDNTFVRNLTFYFNILENTCSCFIRMNVYDSK